jgi:trigger factor
MQVTETLSEGLKREIKVVIPAQEMEQKLNERLADAKSKVRLNGFRAGKVPMSHLKKMYGKSMMADLVNEIIRDRPASILTERGERSATQPEISMTEDEAEANEILNARKDFEFSLAYEVIPPIELKDNTKISVTREVVDVPEADVEEQVGRVAESARSYESKKGKAADGDRVTLDYLGKVDGEPFEGGADQDAELVIGSKRFIPGFEEQLIGLKAGDVQTITVNFPEEYPAAHLKGKEATFDITVKDVAKPADIVIDDDLAKKLGLESADKLREIVRSQIESQYGQMTRQKVKRQILDQLDELYKLTRDLEQSGKSFEDEDTSEEAAREEYRKLAERRVRLGLVLSEIGEKAGVQVSEEELQRAVYDQIRQYPGQERQIMEYFQKTPGAAASLRAPIFEEKVIDHLLGEIAVTDKTVSKEELMADEDDAAEGLKAKDAEKPAKKKAAPKKKSAKKDEQKADDAE